MQKIVYGCKFMSASSMNPVNTKYYIIFIQCWTNVEDVGPPLYKSYTRTNVVFTGNQRNKNMSTLFSILFLDHEIVSSNVGFNRILI